MALLSIDLETLETLLDLPDSIHITKVSWWEEEKKVAFFVEGTHLGAELKGEYIPAYESPQPGMIGLVELKEVR